MYTGDDFNYPAMIVGDRSNTATPCSACSTRSRRRPPPRCAPSVRRNFADKTTCEAPTVPLPRHIFSAPTRFYKTGVVFLAYLNGLQDHFTMLAGQENARSTLHLAELFRLADAAGLLAEPGPRPPGACAHVMATHGVAGVMRDLSNDRALLSINSMTVKPWSLVELGRGLRPRRHLRDRALA